MQNNDPIMLAIGRLEGKMDAILRGQHRIETQIDGHEARIRKHEHYSAIHVGGAATSGAHDPGLVSIFGHRQA